MKELNSVILENRCQLYGLVTLRALIGWHFLYEGISKLINPYWSSAAYLLDSKWVFSGLAKTINFVVQNVMKETVEGGLFPLRIKT